MHQDEKDDFVKKLNQIKLLVDECFLVLSKSGVRVKLDKEIGNNAGSVVMSLAPDFSLSERAYVKRYGKGMNGQKKFTLLLAFWAKGEIGKEIAISEIQRTWNNMTAESLMGYKFNTKYPTEAKTEGWVDSKNPKTYYLCQEWTNIFN